MTYSYYADNVVKPLGINIEKHTRNSSCTTEWITHNFSNAYLCQLLIYLFFNKIMGPTVQ